MFKRICSLLAFVVLYIPAINAQSKPAPAALYEIRVYHYRDSVQESVLDRYFKNALLPALTREKISMVGVFKAAANDTAADKKIYLFIPFGSYAKLSSATIKLGKDAAYQAAGSEYLDAGAKTPAYTRMESIMLEAFPMSPALAGTKSKTQPADRVYELRSYESATEKSGMNKIRMFNEGGEIALFNRLGFDAAFYGKVITGPAMPNLMYLTRFENREARDAHWKAFGEDAEWKKISALPEYQDNVSHIDIIFLRPTVYSAL